MPVRAVWETQERSILRIIYENNWTRDSFHTALEQAAAMLDSVKHLTHIIIDQEEKEIAPSLFMIHAKLLSGITQHPNTSAVIVVGASEITRALCEMVSYNNTLCQNYRFVDTQDDAYDVISQLNFVASLNQLLPEDWPK